MILSPFFISGLILLIPYYRAATYDLASRTVPLSVWAATIMAAPTSILGWITWYYSGTFDSRILLIVIAFILVFFAAGYLWSTGYPSIGGGDILAIILLMLYVPVLPELSMAIFYIFPLLFCTMFLLLGWVYLRKQSIPFILPLFIAHTLLLGLVKFI